MTKTPSLLPGFATHQEQSLFIRSMRLLRDDVIELSGTIGILITLSKRSEDRDLLSVLNKNPVFWNAILNALITSSFVVIGRIHDTTRGAYLKFLMKFATKSKSLSAISKSFDKLLLAHADLITRAVRLRKNVFAHSDFQRPEHIAFGFRDLTWDQFAAYWQEIARVTELLEIGVFGESYGPKCDPHLLQEDIRQANQAFDALLVA